MSLAQSNDPEEIRQEHERAVEALLEISNAVGSVMELPAILRRIVRKTATLMQADVCSLFLYDEGKTVLRLRASRGLNPAAVGCATFARGEGIPGWVAETGQTFVAADATADPRHRAMDGCDEEALRAYLCMPLRIQEEIVGVMTVRKAEVYDFDENNVRLFETICKQAAIVIEKARLHADKTEAERLAAVAVGLSEIAHYIKNLLQAMEGGSFVIEKGLAAGDVERVRTGWQLLSRSNKKIAGLVANMLSYSRPEEPNFSMGNVNDLLKDVVEAARANADRNTLAIVESYEPGLPDMLLDEEFLHDALLNLVTNAMEAMPDQGGVVIVRTRLLKDQDRVLIEVADSGQGIAEENRPKIFNLFFSTKGSNGTGIGLAATRKKIGLHGGEIDFESKVGKGTTFRVYLPIRKEHEHEIP
ncbi:MAG: ATP-binding protein [Candidatus Sumerlaeota bacterium]|nr:ATP-binding protein [Candidatus Sumerlaeota bacterium]